jgi:flagellar biosynthesis/type III secretory pathway chaperone
MTQKIEILVNALRKELEQYGEMLALLESQQQKIVARSADEVFQSIAPIKTQAGVIQEARAHRSACTADLAQSLGRPSETTFAELIPLLPADCRPLLSALVEENNALLVRVRQRVRQNHLRLGRSIELMQNLINSLFPAREPRVYNGQGNTQGRRSVQRWTYEAIG